MPIRFADIVLGLYSEHWVLHSTDKTYSAEDFEWASDVVTSRLSELGVDRLEDMAFQPEDASVYFCWKNTDGTRSFDKLSALDPQWDDD